MAMLERRLFRRDSKKVARALGVASKVNGVEPGVASRMNQVKGAFRGVGKRKTKDVAKQFERLFKRKRRMRMKDYKGKSWWSRMLGGK